MKKELRRFFTDTRMLVTVLLLPGLLIYVMYSVMGDAMGDMFTVEEDYTYRICVSDDGMIGMQEMPYFSALWGSSPVEFTVADTEMGKLGVESGNFDLYAVFDENFWYDIEEYDVSTLEPAPHAALYYNSAETTSQTAYSLMARFLNNLEASMANRLDINTDPALTYDVAGEEETSAMFFSMLMPMFLTMMLFTGAQAVATESIAGEKERGTMAALLITPLKRASIAWGKIAALTIVAVSSGLVTTGFVIASLPKLMNGAIAVETSLYTAGDYVLLGLVLISTAVVYVTIISLLSAFARSVKEAQALVTPMMMLVILIGLTSMFTEGSQAAWYLYLIPLYNSVVSITGIFAAAPDSAGILITTAVNMITAAVGVFGLSRMMNSEKVMFH